MDEQPVVGKRVTVHGRVQGVFFRDSCRAEAEQAGVTGWVRNEDDGTVTAQLEGPADAVDHVVAWCQTGPPRARVRRIDVNDTVPTAATTFEVL